jgi:hypothetical protein
MIFMTFGLTPLVMVGLSPGLIFMVGFTGDG